MRIWSRRTHRRAARLTRPLTELTLTMVPPPRARIPGTTACTIRSGPMVLTARQSASWSSGKCSRGPRPPHAALLTSRSISPASAIQAATEWSSVTSRARRRSAGTRASCRGSRAVATTSHPWSESTRAVAAPIPPAAPVMSARIAELYRGIPALRPDDHPPELRGTGRPGTGPVSPGAPPARRWRATGAPPTGARRARAAAPRVRPPLPPPAPARPRAA